MILPRKRRRLLLVAPSIMLLLLIKQCVIYFKSEVSSNPFANLKVLKIKPPVDLLACRHPRLDPWAKGMMQHFKTVPHLTCKAPTRNWVDVINGRFVIMPSAKEAFGDISCRYIPFIRVTDYITAEGTETFIDNNTLVPHDFFRANCTSSSGVAYSNIHAGIHMDRLLHKGRATDRQGLGLDVLIIGFDSLSRMTFNRKLPKTLKYITEVLNAVILKGYNIVGDGTPQALIPMLTGKNELEQPRPLKRLRNGLRADVYPMAWQIYSRKGYVTAWSEDRPSIGTFTYRMTGFNIQPTDHYMRTFHLKVDPSKHQPLCIDDRPRSRVVLDWMRDFMSMYRNESKFGFMFHSELSHGDSDLVQTTDAYLRDTLRKLHDEKILENTMLIVMSDHGARFSDFRNTLQGKQEERNPFFAFSFPFWFKQKYPEAFKNIQKNSDRLVTPYDIHSTLMDVLEFEGSGLGNVETRGISLFKEIPLHRTCEHAGIEAHWCNCLQWTPIQNNESIAMSAAYALVDHINRITEHKRNICAKLHLKEIVRSSIFMVSPEMLAFKKSFDLDGFHPDMSDSSHVDTIILQMTIYTSPNNGLYESSIRHRIKTNAFIVNTEVISRLNKYGNDPYCIYNTQEQLRKYCFCKDKLYPNPKEKY